MKKILSKKYILLIKNLDSISYTKSYYLNLKCLNLNKTKTPLTKQYYLEIILMINAINKISN